MLREFCFTYEDQQHRLLYEPSAPTEFALREVFERQVYPYLPFLAPGQVVVDIGANVGFSTVLFAALYPRASIYAFEPGREARELLLRNTAQFPQVHVFDYGLLDTESVRPLFHGRESSVTNSLGASCHNGSSSEQVRLRSAAAVWDEIPLSEITLIKVDAEGAELPILRDLSPRISSIQAIMLEYHSEDDRRQIDELLGRTHVLYASHSRQPHRGTVTYVSAQVIAQRTDFNRFAIRLAANEPSDQ